MRFVRFHFYIGIKARANWTELFPLFFFFPETLKCVINILYQLALNGIFSLRFFIASSAALQTGARKFLLTFDALKAADFAVFLPSISIFCARIFRSQQLSVFIKSLDGDGEGEPRTKKESLRMLMSGGLEVRSGARSARDGQNPRLSEAKKRRKTTRGEENSFSSPLSFHLRPAFMRKRFRPFSLRFFVSPPRYRFAPIRGIYWFYVNNLYICMHYKTNSLPLFCCVRAVCRSVGGEDWLFCRSMADEHSD